MMKDESKTKEELIHELAEMRQKLADLKESETKYQRLTEAWRDLWAQYKGFIEGFEGLIYICSPSYEVEFMNRRFIERKGSYPLGQKCYKAIQGREEICPWCVNDRVFKGETMRWEAFSPEDKRWYYVVNTPIRHEDGSISKMMIVQDVTDRKQAEENLRRATRALKTLSACRDALVHAMKESAFLEDVCRIIVEVGGYRLAWVGFALQDEAKTVRPVAQAGLEEGYLETVNITWADTERGQGPTGRAIRTGQTSIVKDLTTDQTYAPWREEALRRGYASSIALPFQEKGTIMGALNIYAAEQDAFDHDERNLLEELAGDVGYGISVLRIRAERNRMEQALREAEEKYRSIFENAVEGIFQSTPEGRLLHVNPALARMHGYKSPEEMISSIMDSGHRVFVDPNCRQEFQREMAKSGVVLGEEHQVYRKDGSKIWVSINARAVRDESGAIKYYEGFIQEITERKQKTGPTPPLNDKGGNAREVF